MRWWQQKTTEKKMSSAVATESTIFSQKLSTYQTVNITISIKWWQVIGNLVYVLFFYRHKMSLIEKKFVIFKYKTSRTIARVMWEAAKYTWKAFVREEHTCFQLLWNILSPSMPNSVSKISPLLVPTKIDPVDASDWLLWLNATAVISWSRNFSIFFGLLLLRCKYSNSGGNPGHLVERAISRWFAYGSMNIFDTRKPVMYFSRNTSVRRTRIV